MSLADSPRLRLLTLCLLYVAQGIPWGFMASTLPGYLVGQGLDFGFVTATLSFTTLPYAFKWVWGPIIDAFTSSRFGRRRPWIVFAQAMMAATVFAIVTIPDLSVQIRLLAWMILIHTVFNALQDVAVDALAVDLLTEKERGGANGLMYGSKYLGGLIGGIGMAKLIAASGLETALVVQTVILLAIMLVPLLVRERAPDDIATARAVKGHGARPPLREIARSLAQAFSLRSTLVTALLMLASSFAIGTVTATAYLLFIGNLGWSYSDYAEISGFWGLLIGGVCAGAAGFLTNRFGRRTVCAVASIALAGGWLFFSQIPDHWQNRDLIYALGFWEGACQSIFTVSLIAMCMDLSWPKISGSQFSAYMALSNFSMTLGYQFAAKANELWEFHGVYIAAAIMQVVVTLLLIPIDPKESRRVLRDDSPIRWLGIGALLALLGFLIVMTIKVTATRLG